MTFLDDLQYMKLDHLLGVRSLFLFNLDLMISQKPAQPLLTDVYLKRSQFFVAREKENSAAGFYIAAQGMHNGKSHNHNDVGNFVLYVDGEPFIIDVGPEGYNAKTFSTDRYSIWTMQSAFHNLPTIDGVMEKEGKQYAARDVQHQSWKDSVRFSLDIAGAYPQEAHVEKWVRSITLDRAHSAVAVTEEFRLGAPSKNITLTLMTSGRVVRTEADRLIVRVRTKGAIEHDSDIEIRFEQDKVQPIVETIRIEDAELHAEWGTDLQRILLVARTPQQQGKYTVSFHRASK